VFLVKEEGATPLYASSSWGVGRAICFCVCVCFDLQTGCGWLQRLLKIQLLSAGVSGALSWLLITKYNAMKSAAAVTAEPAATKNHACHAGINVCKYRKEPIRKNREADPAIEIPSDINTAPVML